MTRNKSFILSVLLCLSQLLSAADFVATITAYNAAELSGEVPAGVELSFTNSNHSKGQLTAGSKATMVISNLPKGVITKVVLYVKSNASSGAGYAVGIIDNTTVFSIPSGNFSQWRDNGYSSAYLPFDFDGLWQTNKGSSLTMEMGATVNSLGWDRVEVTFLEEEPIPNTLLLQWFDADGNAQVTALSEKSAGTGVILPDCPVKKLINEDEWTFVGWTTDKLTGIYTSKPTFMTVGTKFYPKDQQTIYALYQVLPDVKPIVQATEFKTGEYALVMHLLNDYYMADSAVGNKHVLTEGCQVFTNENGLYQLTDYWVPISCRYQVTFEADSLQIQHLQTGAFVGHTSTSLSNNNAKWAWHENMNHSLEVSFNKQSSGVANVLWLTLDYERPYFEAVTLKTGSEYEFILLFDVADAPTGNPSTKWTNYPFGYVAVENVSSSRPQIRKILRNGVLYMEINNAEYNILGNKCK